MEDQLKDFFSNNPECEFIEEKDVLEIRRPWGDRTLSFYLPDEQDERASLVSVLNGIRLPPELSAVLHLESGLLEVLWTAFKLKSHALEVKDREFQFRWEGKNRKCRFGESSDEALTLAKHCYPVANAGSSEHRNIVSFHLFANKIDLSMLDRPMSFFVDCSGLDDGAMMAMLAHLNAYMIYFDRRTPRILVHSEVNSVHKVNNRLMEEKFPGKISGQELDPNLLSYWTEAFSAQDPIMRYLLLYRILEYASFSYIDGETLKAVRRELAKPSLPSNIDTTAYRLAEIIVQAKELEQIPKVQNMVTALVDLEKLWSCIEMNLSYFKEDVVFDGNFCVKALLSGKCDFDNWKPNGIRNTLDRLRNLRNALSHGQDGSTRGTIRPTRQNAQQLVPWLNLLETVASDVMFLHRHT